MAGSLNCQTDDSNRLLSMATSVAMDFNLAASCVTNALTTALQAEVENDAACAEFSMKNRSVVPRRLDRRDTITTAAGSSFVIGAAQTFSNAFNGAVALIDTASIADAVGTIASDIATKLQNGPSFSPFTVAIDSVNSLNVIVDGGINQLGFQRDFGAADWKTVLTALTTAISSNQEFAGAQSLLTSATNGAAAIFIETFVTSSTTPGQ
ncbi:hypothetical protein NA57DRAFT_61478 [Rhizodiscina lignyota]|uniref:Uncharacterized protein n=1 Tax=Rhizodiscina lignyota TaxID=1504668 RepID=A0A9P4I552_9PEZI|nr:hypothetical protein NA57DRAFT_61478 [Rhizodiscina lignyota]